MPQDNQIQQPQMNENFYGYKKRNKIDEIINGVLDNIKKDEKPFNKKKDKNVGYIQKPYSSPF